MAEDEFRTELQWPTDPLGDRPEPIADRAAPVEAPTEQDSQGGPPNREGHDDLGERLLERLDTLGSVVDAQLADLRREQAALQRSIRDLLDQPARPEPGPVTAPSLAPVLAELAQLREELVSLRRRISLRATGQPDHAVLSDEQLARLARSVADLLSGGANQARR